MSGTPSADEACAGVMPNSSGTILDWVPQKAAQQTQSDAANRFMPQPRHAPRGRPRAIFGPSVGPGKPSRAVGRGTLARPWRENAGAPWQEDGALLWTVTVNGSLGRDQMLRRGGALTALRTGGFRPPADVPGAEQ